jgi:hypothetical protein
VTPRLRELQGKRAELEAQAAGLVSPAQPSARLHDPKAIERFQERLRDIFVSNDTALTKIFLQFLVEKIVVHQDKVEIHGKGENAAALMASDPSKSTGGAGFSLEGGVGSALALRHGRRVCFRPPRFCFTDSLNTRGKTPKKTQAADRA